MPQVELLQIARSLPLESLQYLFATLCIEAQIVEADRIRRLVPIEHHLDEDDKHGFQFRFCLPHIANSQAFKVLSSIAKSSQHIHIGDDELLWQANEAEHSELALQIHVQFLEQKLQEAVEMGNVALETFDFNLAQPRSIATCAIVLIQFRTDHFQSLRLVLVNYQSLVNLDRSSLDRYRLFNVAIVLQERPFVHEELKLTLCCIKLGFELEVLRGQKEANRLCIWAEDVRVSLNV